VAADLTQEATYGRILDMTKTARTVAQPSQLDPAEYEEHLAQLDDLLAQSEEEGW
jgi:hypothetical protein